MDERGRDPGTETETPDGETASDAVDRADTRIRPGDRIGRFTVSGILGEGGMGVVLAARDPALHRKVAIKLVHAVAPRQTPSPHRHARLKREAQAMAKLSHPNIVVVHEVGTVGDRVFVAMEHIDGCSLRAWLAEQPRPWREVVDVFAKAGRGLAAAHAAGLVHRDFKPDNVLIARDGRVRVTDFGLVGVSGAVASLQEDHDSERPPLSSDTPLAVTLTHTGALLGTPLYMAPEQHDRASVDARADQFSFCVALYEALYHQHPFAARRYHELLVKVRAARIPDPPSDSEVPQWLHDVVVRGLRSKPEERYPSMDALLADLQGDPRAMRRRRLAIGGVVAVAAVLAIVAAIGLTSAGGGPGRRCKGAAEQLAGIWDDDTRRAVRRSFVDSGRPYAEDTYARTESLLDSYARRWVAMRTEACKATHVHAVQSEEVLDLRMRCLDRRRRGLSALVEVFADGADDELLDKAVPAAARLRPLDRCADAEALRAAVPPPENPDDRRRIAELRELLTRAEALERAGKVDAAIETAARVVSGAREVGYAPLQAEALLVHVSVQGTAAKPETAEADLREAAQAAAQSRQDELAARIQTTLLWVVGVVAARYDDSLALRVAADAAILRAGNTPELRARLALRLGDVLQLKGDFAEARTQYEAALEIYRSILDPDHPDLAIPLNNIGLVTFHQGDYEAAVGYLEKALAVFERAFGPEHPQVGAALQGLGMAVTQMGRHDQALTYLRRALAIREEAFGAEHPSVATTCNSMAITRHYQGAYAEARDLYERALTIREKLLGPDHPDVAKSLSNLGTVYVDLEDLEQARTYFERALAAHERISGPDDPEVAFPVTNIAHLLSMQDKCDEALPYYERALHLFEKKFGPDHFYVSHAVGGVGNCLFLTGQPVQALPFLERALAIRTSRPGDPGEVAESRFELARALWAAGRNRKRAIALAKQARDAYAEMGARRAERLTAIEAWLKARGR